MTNLIDIFFNFPEEIVSYGINIAPILSLNFQNPLRSSGLLNIVFVWYGKAFAHSHSQTCRSASKAEEFEVKIELLVKGRIMGSQV